MPKSEPSFKLTPPQDLSKVALKKAADDIANQAQTLVSNATTSREMFFTFNYPLSITEQVLETFNKTIEPYGWVVNIQPAFLGVNRIEAVVGGTPTITELILEPLEGAKERAEARANAYAEALEQDKNKTPPFATEPPQQQPTLAP
jgi:uncharacterized protein YggE